MRVVVAFWLGLIVLGTVVSTCSILYFRISPALPRQNIAASISFLIGASAALAGLAMGVVGRRR